MVEMMDRIAVVLIPAVGIMGALCVANKIEKMLGINILEEYHDAR